jgi:hypothetical protein
MFIRKLILKLNERLNLRWKRTWASVLISSCLYLIPLFYLSLSFGIVVLISRSGSLEALLSWWVAWRPDGIDPGTMVTYFLTPAWYAWVKAHAMLLMVGIAAAVVVYVAYSNRVWAFLRAFHRETGRIFRLMADSYRQSSRREKAGLWILLSCILAYRLYLCLVYPMHMEDLASYLFFARQGFLVTLTCYPIANNHILFNLIGVLPAKMHWIPPALANRLPSVAGDLLLQYGIFCLFRRWGGYQRAVIVITGIAFCYMIALFATRGRGYQLQESCALISGLAAWVCYCSDRREERRGYTLFVLFSAAGLYINPTFVYHFTAVIGMVLFFSVKRRQWGVIRSMVRAVLLICAITFICYLPPLLAGKMGGLWTETTGRAGWGWVVEQGWLLAYILRVIGYLGDLSSWVIGGIAVLLLVMYGRKKLTGRFYDAGIVYLGCVLVSLACWSILTKAFPPVRTLCFLALGLYVVFVNACYDLWKAFLPGARPWVLWCFLLVRAAVSLRGLYWESSGVGGTVQAREYREIEPDLTRLAALHPRTWQITKADDFYPMHLRLYLLEHDSTSRVLWNKEAAIGEVIFLPKKYASTMVLDGYNLWGESHWTVEGDELYIYVAKALLSHKAF